MRVAQLIADTEWFPGHDLPAQPVVSVLMPTFRRGADGLFLRAARSVLGQSLRQLELIVVDDASTDGTAEQLRDLMLEDGRVSCLRHPRNVGLPAVSEYEAYVRSRGRFIAFAFDDFLFEPDAIGAMARFMDEAKSAAAYGFSALVDSGGGEHPLRPDTLDGDRLRFMNCVGNSAVMLARDTIEEVGLYDPHVALTRLCDWDLWRRIAAHKQIDRTDIFVGRELGLGRKDSLGNSYPMHFEVMQEYMALPRDDLLRPSKFSDFDVWTIPARASWPLREHVISTQTFFKTKAWAPPADVATAAAPSPRRVLTVIGEPTASIDLYWSGLEGDVGAGISFLPPQGFSELVNDQSIRSDLVVIARDLYSGATRETLRFLAEAGVPAAYFVDDNFALLAEEDPAWKAYTCDAMRETLSKFACVIVTSEALKAYFEEHRIHDRIYLVNCILDKGLLKRQRRLKARRPDGDRPLRIGCVGGAFRMDNLIDEVCPALDALGRPIELYVRRTSRSDEIELRNGTVHAISPHPEFRRFLDEWCALDLDIIVHPCGDTSNITFKSDNAALVALYLGAGLILCDERAYADLGEREGVMKVDGKAPQWRAAIDQMAMTPYRDEAIARLEAHCRAAYDGDRMKSLLEMLAADLPPIDAIKAARRGRAAFKLMERKHFHG